MNTENKVFILNNLFFIYFLKFIKKGLEALVASGPYCGCSLVCGSLPVRWRAPEIATAERHGRHFEPIGKTTRLFQSWVFH
ncbi:hypothetical protein [Companilactobacillus zhongbaensis]|uniref:hypothetical protein n=1 Tax=Companilactobacillus zhongbaensis TaxID=2486009 RepID=UPI000F79FEDB|nr:hypothetical protein [Companilactobacillus zhongbaensis]